jgi:hypothetical protein
MNLIEWAKTKQNIYLNPVNRKDFALDAMLRA